MVMTVPTVNLIEIQEPLSLEPLGSHLLQVFISRNFPIKEQYILGLVYAGICMSNCTIYKERYLILPNISSSMSKAFLE